MPAAKWPQVKAWLLDAYAALPSASTTTVFNGMPVTKAAPRSFVTVGFVEDDNGGTYSQQTEYDGSVWSEVGEVRSKIVVNSGNSDPSTAEAAAFAIAGDLSDVIDADQTLSHVLSPEANVFCAVDVLSISNSNGTATELVHTVRYTTTV